MQKPQYLDGWNRHKQMVNNMSFHASFYTGIDTPHLDLQKNSQKKIPERFERSSFEIRFWILENRGI